MLTGERALPAGLLLATAVGAALRFSSLGTVPVALYCDEAFAGYQAYSLLLTGRDSRGVSLPLFFDIFGVGWGEPLYIYLTVVPVALLGLTPAAARGVAAAAGTLVVPVTGLLTAALLRRGGGADPRASRAGLLAAVLMAVSPWSFHFSRVAFQASLLPLALAGSFLLARRALRDDDSPPRMWPLLAAALALAGSLYTYTVARLAMPLLLAGFAWLYRARLRRAAPVAVGALACLAAASLPVVIFSATEAGRVRLSGVSLLNLPEVRDHGALRAVPAAVRNYLSYFSPAFLLTEGDPNPRHSVRGHGVLHPHELLLAILGAVWCAARGGRGGRFLLWWVLAAPVAASLTMDPRHAVRAIGAQPALYALAGAGAAALADAARRLGPGRGRALARGALAAFAVAGCVSATGYFRDYFLEYPGYSGPAWQYGLKEAYDYAESKAAGHDSIYVTRNEDYPFVHLLFHRAFPPQEYQAHGLSRTRWLFGEEFFYRGEAIPNRRNPIFICKPYEVPAEGVTVRHLVAYPDGAPAFAIAW